MLVPEVVFVGPRNGGKSSLLEALLGEPVVYSGQSNNRVVAVQLVHSAKADQPRIVLKREQLMGVGQMITMPLFFASNALYPVKIMPGWVRVLSKINPLSYEVDALRALLIGTAANLWLDFGVLLLAVTVGVTVASSLIDRLAR